MTWLGNARQPTGASAERSCCTRGGVGSGKDACPFELNERRTPEVNVGRRVKPQPGRVVLVVVPTEEALAEDASVLDRAEAIGEVRSKFERPWRAAPAVHAHAAVETGFGLTKGRHRGLRRTP